MEMLTRAVNSAIYALTENRDDLDKLEQELGLTTAVLRESVTGIRGSVEEGIVEYKGRILRGTYSTIDSLQYDSRNLSQLSEEQKKLSALVYATIIQHNIAAGIISLRIKSDQQDNSEIISEEMNIKEIIQDVTGRIKQDPSFQEKREVKNILLQIKQYRTEMAELAKLKENIPKEKLPGLAANFNSRFAKISASITENYKAITSEEMKSEIMAKASHPLQIYRLNALTKPLWGQVRHFSLIHSTVTFIARERFQTREHLVNLNNRKEESMSFLNNELLAYRELTGSESEAAKINRLLCLEVMRILEKQISWRITKKME